MTTAGNIVGSRYRLEQRIAQGGMGEVWRATHVSLLSPVAIKFMKPGAGDERFLRECRIAAALRHPNVVTIIDEGMTADGRMFLVMEYLEGISLASRMAQLPALSVRQVCHVVSEVLRALQAVHGKGIVHRDLKPDNVFLLRQEDDLDKVSVKVLDFGVAHACLSSALALPVANLTVTGCTVGTPWYMAPEQARGLEVQPASDLFSLGVMLYRCLTGRFPFEGATLPDIVLKLVTTAPVPPHEYRPELPSALSDVILRALAVTPEERFETAQAMRKALLACALPDAPAAVLEPPAAEPESLASGSIPAHGVKATAFEPAQAAGASWSAPMQRHTLPETPSSGLPVLHARSASVVEAAMGPRVRRSTAAAMTAALVAALISGWLWWPKKTTTAATEPVPVGSSVTAVPPSPRLPARDMATHAETTVATQAQGPKPPMKLVSGKRVLKPFRSPGF